MDIDKQTIITAREINHGSRFVGRGEELECSATDAGYYATRRIGTYKTRDLTAEPPAPAPAPQPAPPPPAPAPEIAPVVEAVPPEPVKDKDEKPKEPDDKQEAELLSQVEAAVATDEVATDASPNEDEPEQQQRTTTTRRGIRRTAPE